jgi:hypothetical protein
MAVLCCVSRAAAAPPDHEAAKSAHVSKGAPVKLALIPDIGFSENAILSADPARSLQIAALGKAANANFWRMNIYFQSPSDTSAHNIVPTYHGWFCNAVKALASVGIPHLMLTFMPTVNTGYPNTLNGLSANNGQGQKELDYLNQVIDSFLVDVYGQAPLAACGLSTDGKLIMDVMVQAGNEMNIDTFCSPQNDDDHLACAQIAAYMQASVYTFIKKTEVPKFGVPIPVIGASVASHHTPFLYLSQYRHKLSVLTHCVCMDGFDFHQYAQWGSCDQMSGFKMYPKLVTAGRATFGKIFGTARLPIGDYEWGLQTQESTEEGYLWAEPASCQVIPESQQSAVWTQAIGYAQQQHLQAFVSMLLLDEQDMLHGFQSGLWNYKGDRAKPGAAAISQLILNARAP